MLHPTGGSDHKLCFEPVTPDVADHHQEKWNSTIVSSTTQDALPQLLTLYKGSRPIEGTG